LGASVGNGAGGDGLATGNDFVAFVGAGTGGDGILDVTPAARVAAVPVGGAGAGAGAPAPLAAEVLEAVEVSSPS